MQLLSASKAGISVVNRRQMVLSSQNIADSKEPDKQRDNGPMPAHLLDKYMQIRYQTLQRVAGIGCEYLKMKGSASVDVDIC